jgi:hypothetical protein
MDPLDAVVLELIGTVSGAPAPNARDYVKARTSQSDNEVLVSFENLVQLGCLATASEAWNPNIRSRGKLLLEAVK